MGDWKKVRLSDLGQIVGGATPSTKREEYYNGDIPWITPKDLSGFNGRYISQGERSITREAMESCSTQMLPPNSILFSSRAPIGYVAIAQNALCTNQGFKSIIPNEEVDYLFLYYLLKHNKDKIEAMGSGTTFKEVSGSTMRSVEVFVPTDINTQKKISAILDAIDCKIENNRKINDNLLDQLRAIFISEFTDNPNLEQMRQIPLAELCSVVTKGTTPTTLGKPFVSEGINFIKAESILDNHFIDTNKFAYIDEETNAMLKRSIIQAGDILFTIAGTLGRFALVDDSIVPANTNQAVAIIRADKAKISPEYLYCCFVGNWHIDYYTKRIQQAVQANLSLTTIKSLPIPILPEVEMQAFIQLISPIMQMLSANESENLRLTAIRDSLLPRLMSGELDVSEVDT